MQHQNVYKSFNQFSRSFTEVKTTCFLSCIQHSLEIKWFFLHYQTPFFDNAIFMKPTSIPVLQK